MKVNRNFVLRKVGNRAVAVPVGSACDKFNGMVKLNATAELVWESLLAGETEDQTIAKMLDQYEVTEEHARSSYHTVVDQMLEIGALSPEN